MRRNVAPDPFAEARRASAKAAREAQEAADKAAREAQEKAEAAARRAALWLDPCVEYQLMIKDSRQYA